MERGHETDCTEAAGVGAADDAEEGELPVDVEERVGERRARHAPAPPRRDRRARADGGGGVDVARTRRGQQRAVRLVADDTPPFEALARDGVGVGVGGKHDSGDGGRPRRRAGRSGRAAPRLMGRAQEGAEAHLPPAGWRRRRWRGGGGRSVAAAREGLAASGVVLLPLDGEQPGRLAGDLVTPLAEQHRRNEHERLVALALGDAPAGGRGVGEDAREHLDGLAHAHLLREDAAPVARLAASLGEGDAAARQRLLSSESRSPHRSVSGRRAGSQAAESSIRGQRSGVRGRRAHRDDQPICQLRLEEVLDRKGRALAREHRAERLVLVLAQADALAQAGRRGRRRRRRALSLQGVEHTAQRAQRAPTAPHRSGRQRDAASALGVGVAVGRACTRTRLQKRRQQPVGAAVAFAQPLAQRSAADACLDAQEHGVES